MHIFKIAVISLLSGAVLTTTAEYIFRYNLLDLVIDKVKGLFIKEKAALKSRL